MKCFYGHEVVLEGDKAEKPRWAWARVAIVTIERRKGFGDMAETL